MREVSGNVEPMPVAAGGGRIYGVGEMAERIRAKDWDATALGPLAEWPEALVVLVNMMLANQHPMLLFWGDDLIQIYNDATIPTIGAEKQSTALGQPAEECWAEVWHVVGAQIRAALCGEPVWREDQLAPIFRDGAVRDSWFTYSYSPVRDGEGQIKGVLVTMLETTRRVQAERGLKAERNQLLRVFEQAPAFFAVLRGPLHVFERVNPQYQRVIGGLDVVGKPLREALPGIEKQGYVDILDRVYTLGEPYVAADAQFTTPDGVTRTVDFVYQPLREADGSISGILVLGVDMTERKRMTEALLEVEGRAAMVLESISEGFQITDAEGRFRQINAAARAMLRSHGVDPDALIGTPLRDAFPGYVDSDAGRVMTDKLRQGIPVELESFHAPWNKWFWVRNHPLPDGGVATFYQDITEQKRTERQLREQRERFTFATQAAQIGYWFCDLPFETLTWDATVKGHFGLAPETEHIDMKMFYSLLHPDDREATRRAVERSIGEHQLYDVEYRTIAPDGRQRWIRAIGRTAYDEDGTPRRFDGVTQEITELKQARELLDAERARLSAVLENVPVGIMFTLTDGRIVSGNRHAESILGMPLNGGVLATYTDITLLYPDGRKVEPKDRPLTRVLQNGNIHRGEYQYERPDGVLIWVEVIGAPILDVHGNIVGAVDAIADIDVRKRAEEALVRSEKLALVGRLAASISHEINNPLESVTNLLYLIEHGTQDEATRNFSRMAQDELARVAHIVTHTLRFNRQSLGWGEQKMSGLLESSVAIYEGRLKNSGVSLRREYGDTQNVQCAGSEIRQVFANLIANAFDATRSGGKLILRTRDVPHPRTGKPGVRVSIADTGHGMPIEVRRRLFEPFFTTKGENGTGLGLWVSREILSKHQADVRVRSRQAPAMSGTVFSIWFAT